MQRPKALSERLVALRLYARDRLPRALLRVRRAVTSLIDLSWRVLVPFLGAVLAILGVFAGLWFSLYADKVKQNLPYPFEALARYKDNFESLGFGWGLFLLFVVLAVVLQLIRSTQNAAARRELENEAQRLRGAVESLRSIPPAGYMSKYQDMVRLALPGYYSVALDSDAGRGDYEVAMRQILNCITKLAWLYAGAEQETDGHAAANIMMAITPARFDRLSESEKASIRSELRFCPREDRMHPQQHRLLLRLIPDLTSASDGASDGKNPSGERDRRAPSLCMPVPHDFKRDRGAGGEVWRVLPGAPFAAATRSFAYYGSIGGPYGLLDWCKAEADLTEEVRDEIQEYFSKKGPGAHIKSFVAVPLILHVPGDEDPGGDFESWMESDGRRGLLVGVLNIHATYEGMFKESGLRLFLPLIEPFRSLLNVMMARYLYLTGTDTIRPKENSDEQQGQVSVVPATQHR